jgi:hypothetical protein
MWIPRAIVQFSGESLSNETICGKVWVVHAKAMLEVIAKALINSSNRPNQLFNLSTAM